MKLPAHFTHFLACIEGEHGNCQHVDSEGLLTWVCQCECHPLDLASPDNNYIAFDPLPLGLQEVLRYAGYQPGGVPKGVRRCRDCGEWRGFCLVSQDPLQWHLGLQRIRCRCAER